MKLDASSLAVCPLRILDEETSYIATDDPRAARFVVASVLDAVAALAGQAALEKAPPGCGHA